MLLVFISHSSADRQFVESELIPLLKRHGVPCWYSPVDIQTASDWEAAIRNALIEAEWFLVVLSPSSVSSDWVKTEVNWALENRKDHVVPIMVSDCDPGDLHLKLQRIQYIDCRHAMTTARRRIVQAVGGVWVEDDVQEPSAERGADAAPVIVGQSAGSIVHDLAKYGGYEVTSTLARTGLGLVLLARHSRLGTDVVVKTHDVRSLSPEEVTGLENRVKDRARLVHPSFVSIQQVFTVGGCLYVVEEHIPGAINIWERNQRSRSRLTAEDVAAVLTQITTGLSYAHRFGIVHGAIDPYSVLIAPDGRARLAGLERMPISDVCDEHSHQGTLRYVAPEQLMGRQCTKQTDVWLLGLVLYEMLTGEAPFSNQYDIMSYMGSGVGRGARTRELSMSSKVPKQLIDICERCLEVDEESRYGDASEVLRALQYTDSRKGLLGRLRRSH